MLVYRNRSQDKTFKPSLYLCSSIQHGASDPIANYFGFDEYSTDYGRETLAGVTTFLAMAYIIVVNPAILSNAILFNHETGEFESETVINGTAYTGAEVVQMLTVVTILASIVAILVMALYANRPFGLRREWG